MIRSIVLQLMYSGRANDWNLAQLGSLRQQGRVAAGAGGHRIDDPSPAGGAKRPQVLQSVVDVGKHEFRKVFVQPCAVHDDVLMRVAHAQRTVGRKITEHGAHEAASPVNGMLCRVGDRR